MRWLLLLLVLLPSVALAQEPISPDPPSSPPVEAIPPGDDVIVPLPKGHVAPFGGQLYDPLTALRWANWLQQYKYRLKWDVEKEQKVCTVEKKYRDDLLKAEETRALKVEADLVERLGRSEQARLNAEEEARNPPWYSTTAFGVVIGAVATAAVFGIAVAAIDATRP
jgi:hypothetical protein